MPQTDVGTFTLEQAADLVLFEWSEATGLLAGIDTQVGERVALDVEVCDSAGTCLDPRNLTGPVPFAAGVGALTVTASRPTSVEVPRICNVPRMPGRNRATLASSISMRIRSWLVSAIRRIGVGMSVMTESPAWR